MRYTPQRDVHAQGVHVRAPFSIDPKRRRFMLALGAGTAGSAAAAAHAMAPTNVAIPQPEKSRGYQETEHVRDYYATARI